MEVWHYGFDMSVFFSFGHIPSFVDFIFLFLAFESNCGRITFPATFRVPRHSNENVFTDRHFGRHGEAKA
jgi:hypothetical protein